MGNLRQKQSQQAKASVKQQTQSSKNTHFHPAEELPEIVGNQALGRLIKSQSSQEQPADNSSNLLLRQISTANNFSIQRRSLFRGLSHELMGNGQANVVQAKLTVNQPGDKYEQEADRVADLVVQQMNAPSPQSTQSEETMQPQMLMRKAEGKGGGMATSAEFEASLKQEQGKGQPLDRSIREPMEQAFGADFSGVRIHTDPSSDVLSEAIQSQAFTKGRDVFFRQGVYQPESRKGQKLIAHELTHVVQQNGHTSPGNEAVIQRIETKLLSQEKGKKTKEEEKYIEIGGLGYKNVNAKTSTLAGAEIAAKKIIEAKSDDFKAACDLLTRAGFLGNHTTTKEIGNFSRNSSQDIFAGVEFKGKVSAEVKDVIEGIKLLAESSLQAGMGMTLAETLSLNAGKYNLELKGKLEKFVGFKASAKGELKLNVLDGLVVSGSAEAEAGVAASTSGSAQLSRGSLGAQVAAEVKGNAGALAKASGKTQLGPAGISVSGNAEAFAGAKVSGKVSGSFTTRKGNKLINVSTGGLLSTGVGAKAKGELTYQQGTFKLGTGVGGTLGVGAGAEIEIEIDIAAIKNAIKDACSAPSPNKLSSKVAATRPNMPENEAEAMKKELYLALKNDVYTYAKSKAENKRAKHYVKREKVQEIIFDKVKNSDRLAEIIWYKESDEVLAKMAYDATKLAADEAGNRELAGNTSENSFSIKRGIILWWPYTSDN